MPNEIVLRSAALDDTVKSVSTFNAARRRLGRSSLSEMGGMSFGGGGQVPHQFTVTDSSTYNDDGTVKQLQVTVSEGMLNDVTYPSTDIPLTVGIAKFWIYAIDGKFYALNHEFQSDYFPVLLCGIVEVVEGKLSITQVNYRDYPYVPVCGSEYGAVMLAGTLAYADHVLTANYTVAVKGLLNNNALNFPATVIPVAGNGTLLAYVKLLTVGNDVTPESGFEFSATGQPSQSVEWYQSMFQYTLTANIFKVLFRQHPLQMFTFTRIYLNASESGA